MDVGESVELLCEALSEPLPANTSVVILVDEQNRVLLLLRGAAAPWMPLKWGLPGGLIESSETPTLAAIREAFEETNLLITDLQFEVEFNQVMFYSTRCFSGDIQFKENWDEVTQTMIIEHDEHAWVSIDLIDSFDIIPGYQIPDLIRTVLTRTVKGNKSTQ